jgi:hypothetical protein
LSDYCLNQSDLFRLLMFLCWIASHYLLYLPLTLWVRISLRRGVLDTILCDKVCQWLEIQSYLQIYTTTGKQKWTQGLVRSPHTFIYDFYHISYYNWLGLSVVCPFISFFMPLPTKSKLYTYVLKSFTEKIKIYI